MPEMGPDNLFVFRPKKGTRVVGYCEPAPRQPGEEGLHIKVVTPGSSAGQELVMSVRDAEWDAGGFVPYKIGHAFRQSFDDTGVLDWKMTHVHDGSVLPLGWYKVEAEVVSGRGGRRVVGTFKKDVPHWEIVEEDSDQ